MPELITESRNGYETRAIALARDPGLASERGQALRVLLYLFERDEAVRLIGAG